MSADGPSSTVSSSPTKNVWSPVRDLVDRARRQPADGTDEQTRVVLAHLDAVPERDRRHAAREVLREVLLLAREHRRRPLACIAQQLVERCLQCDRDADEPRLEREREERRDRQPGAAPVDLGDDDRHPGGPPPEERTLLGSPFLHGCASLARVRQLRAALAVAELRDLRVQLGVQRLVVRRRPGRPAT